MKKNFFLIVCLVLVTDLSLYGFEKGTKSVGGTISFNGYKGYNDAKTRYTLSIAPLCNYFVFDNFSIDAQVLLGTSWGGYTPTATDLGFGLGGRYFFKQFYAGLFFNYLTSRRIITSYVDDVLVYEGINWRSKKELTFRAGRLFGIAKNIYLDLGVYYNMGIGKINNSADVWESFDNDRSEFGTLAGIAIFF